MATDEEVQALAARVAAVLAANPKARAAQKHALFDPRSL
jgi:hypothetical protein